MGDGVADGACGRGFADVVRKVLVGRKVAHRDAQQRFPDLDLKISALETKREWCRRIRRRENPRRHWRGRLAILDKACEIMVGRAEELAIEAAREGGKPLIDSRVEVARAIDGVRLCSEVLRTQHGSEIPMGVTPAASNRLAFTHFEPIGVVVAVSAFNHPLNLIVHQTAPAVAVGCPVIVKPAEDTPLSCFRFVQILHEAGLPEAWCQALVAKQIPVAEQLVVDSRVGFFSFIGSA